MNKIGWEIKTIYRKAFKDKIKINSHRSKLNSLNIIIEIFYYPARIILNHEEATIYK